FYESVDYTESRVPPGRRSVIVRAFMAHHQGMALVALGNALHGDLMQRRFHADPRVRATELLLQERSPAMVDLYNAPSRDEGRQTTSPVNDTALSEYPARLDAPVPSIQLLSNGTYSVLVTASG